MQCRRILVSLLLLLIVASPAWARGRKLSDQEMDQVASGQFTVELLGGVWKMAFDSGAGAANRVTGEGTLSWSTVPLNGVTNSVTLSGNAQQNLSSIVNIIAVNSLVNVLLNLNIAVNSTIGSITQQNLTAIP